MALKNYKMLPRSDNPHSADILWQCALDSYDTGHTVCGMFHTLYDNVAQPNELTLQQGE